MAVDAKVMSVILGIKQAIETSQNPGLSVNSHPNALFLKVIGDLDLLKIAQQVLINLHNHEEGVKARFESRVKKLAEDVNAELKAGAADVASAFGAVGSRLADKYTHTEEEISAAFKRVTAGIEKKA